MKRDFEKWVNGCEICKTQKYERTPKKQLIGLTPIPTRVGESISMDMFYIDNKQYVTSVDRYSKYLTVNLIETKINFQEKLEEILTQSYPNCKYLITDNEKPVDVKLNPIGYPHIYEKLLANQKIILEYHNKKRENRKFEPNETIYVKSNRRRKDANAYVKHIVKEDLKNTILTTKNKIIHKDNIRKNKP